MTVELNETLSAMVDGEASELELGRVLTTMSDEKSQTWQRYQAASSILKQDKDLFWGGDISAAVSRAISHEKPHSTRSFAVWKRAAWKPVVSFAAAASITLAVFVGLQLNQAGVSGYSTEVYTVAQEAANRVSSGSQGLSLAGSEGFSTASAQLLTQNTQLAKERAIADAIAAERLQNYLNQHTAHSAYNNNQGALPFARVEEAQQP